MSRIVRFHEIGGPEVLRIEDIAPAQPGPGEIRIRVKAMGVNRADILMRSGNLHPDTFPSQWSGT